MNNRSIVVLTGVRHGDNDNIGYQLVQLLSSDAAYELVIAAVHQEAPAAADSTNNRVRYHALELDDDESIQRFVRYVVAVSNGKRVILINNAAIALEPNSAQSIVRINLLQTLALTVSLLEARVVERIIMVASELVSVSEDEQLQTKIVRGLEEARSVADVEALARSLKLRDVGDAYGFSKWALVFATKLLALEQPDKSIVSVSPGFCRTKMTAKQAQKAPRSARDGALSIISVLERTITQSGAFYNFRGDEIKNSSYLMCNAWQALLDMVQV